MRIPFETPEFSRVGITTHFATEDKNNSAARQGSITARGEPSRAVLKLYSKLKKAESSALFQARTGRIGLRRFLAISKVPGIESEDCLCGGGRETAEHMLLHCDDRPRAYWSRGAVFHKLVSEPETGAIIARQLIQSGKLGQFSLASRLLYGQ